MNISCSYVYLGQMNALSEASLTVLTLPVLQPSSVFFIILYYGSYMSLFDTWISAIAVFNLGQMKIFIEASLTVLTLPVLQPSSVFSIHTLLLICALRVALGVVSSADRWAQLWTSGTLDQWHCMCVACMCVCTGRYLMLCYPCLRNVCFWWHHV